MTAIDKPPKQGNESSSSVSDRKRKSEAMTDDDDDDDDDSVESEESSAHAPVPDPADAPRVVDGIAEFKISPIIGYLTCPLCLGLFRDPVTITKCLHSFCKSCLFTRFSGGVGKCPTCEVHLGYDPFKAALNDEALKDMTDKILFPDVREKDAAAEKAFYAALGMSLKPEFDKHAKEEDAAPAVMTDDELEFTLVPDEHADGRHELPRMARSNIKTSGRFKIVHLKKYLLNQLKMPPTLLSSVEVVCNGSPVGNELSISFIDRTMWVDTKNSLRLTYRIAEDFFEER